MNKDLDERLVPNGEYRDALNLDLANSEGSNVGSLQNVKGNTLINGKWTEDFISDLENPVCIGSIADTENDKLYWLVASDNYDVIAEYDANTGDINPVFVSQSNGALNFSKTNLITGINILEGFLIFTDNLTEPKSVNIKKFKAGSVDFLTETRLPDYNPNTKTYVYNSSNAIATEEYITVIRKGPLNAPTLELSASEFGQGVYGTGITPANVYADNTNGYENFTYVPDTVNDPAVREPLPTWSQHLQYLADNPGINPTYPGSSIQGWDGIAEFIAPLPVDPTVWEQGRHINLKATILDDQNQQFEYSARMLIMSVSGQNVRARIESISSDVKTFTVPILWEAVVEEDAPMFEYIFPRFAYRWKYQNNQYSVFSPFTEVAFLGDDFEYVASDGYNIGMTNNIRKLVIKSLDWGNEDVEELDILYKESNNNLVYKVDTLKKIDGEVSEYEIKSELINSVVEANQILRPWDNVPRQALAQEIIGNRIVYANYLQNYNVDDKVDLKAYTESSPVDVIGKPNKSVKAIRDYEIGVVFKDEYGRETPVFTSANAGFNVPVEDAQNKTSIYVSPNGSAPDWATHFKFFIKETSNEYYNLALDRFYPAEDGNIWLSFPSSERNKVDEETYLILKKQHTTNQPVDAFARYKILAIENEAPDFVKTFKRAVAFSKVTVESGFNENSLILEFDGPDPGQFSEELNADHFIEIQVGGQRTDRYRITSGGRTGAANIYEITLERPLGTESFFLNSLNQGDDVDINVYKNSIENKPEFEGRFFVKINKDFNLEENVINPFEEIAQRFGSLGRIEIKSFQVNDELRSNSPAWGLFYSDPGESRRNKDAKPLRGSGAWGTVHNTYPDVIKNNYNPPTKGNKWFGFTQAGSVSGNDYGPVLGKIIQFALQDAQLGVGKYLRFLNGATGEPVEDGPIYEIKELHVGRYQRSESSVTEGSNFRNVYLIRLDREIEDDIVPQFAGDYSRTPDIEILEKVIDDNNKLLSTTNPAVFETEPKENVELDIYFEASDAIPVSEYSITDHRLNWFNCYSYGNGVESNRIRDDFNAVTIDKGVKASTVLDEPYMEERRKSSFVFSQIFNSNSGINRLNQFIQALPITKEINPIYGSIQKLHARNTDLITLCEDKCFKVLANKDALFNADGNTNVTSNNNVLGQTIPFAGEYGISTNPESFASFGYQSYFTDKRRGAVIRLSMDGITLISDKGMSDFFEDNLRFNSTLIGSYDADKGLYNLTLNNLSDYWKDRLSQEADYHLSDDCDATSSNKVTKTTISFKEGVGGWTSRKSFIPENGLSLNNVYYTFNNGLLWQHNSSDLRNNFYGVQYNSAFTMLLNESFNSVKGFSTLNYNGTQSRRFEYLYNNKWYSIDEINALAVSPTNMREKIPGWFVNYVKTNLEGGEVKEFLRKEDKYFNYIKGLSISDQCNMSEGGGGIGSPVDIISDDQIYKLTVKIDCD